MFNIYGSSKRMQLLKFLFYVNLEWHLEKKLEANFFHFFLHFIA